MKKKKENLIAGYLLKEIYYERLLMPQTVYESARIALEILTGPFFKKHTPFE